MLRRGGISAGIAALAVVGVVAVPALAGIGDLGTVDGFTYLHNSGSLGSAGDGEVTVPCPAGKSLVGGGASIDPSHGRGRYIHSSGPVDGPDGDSAPDDQWRLGYHVGNKGGDGDVIAVCADTAPNVVTRTDNIPAGKTGKATAPCPSDMHVSGGGVAVEGDPTESFVNSSFPTDAKDGDHSPDDGWTGRAATPSGGAATMTVTALCVSSNRTYMPTSSGSVKPHGGTASVDYCKGQTGALSGAGLQIPGPGTQARILAAEPNDDPTAGDPNTTPEERIVWAMANLHGDRKKPTAYAICKP